MILRRRRLRASKRAPLIVCRTCGTDYVIPVEWTEDGPSCWWMRLRCGECGSFREVVVSNELAQRYNADLNRGVDLIAGSLRRVEQAAMAALADRLATALRLDLVDAADFGATRRS